MIIFDKVGKKFGKTDAVKDFSLTIQEKEILGLLGPNGAGKSTLMLMMGTVYRPSSGTILVHDYDVVKQPNEVRKLIGIAFQDARVDGILGAYDCLNWHLKMTTSFDKEEREKRVESVLKALDLWDARNKRTWLMSGGMKKKVEDAKILAQRPRIAVFDEPTAFLDVPSRLLVWRMIRETGTSESLKSSQKGGEVLELTVANGSDVPKELFTQFKDVSDVATTENKVMIYLTAGRLLLPKIVEAVTSKGIEIHSVHLKEVTLEDVFLRYTGQRLE